MDYKKSFFTQSFLRQLLTFLQIPCSSYDASLWMEQTITNFEINESTRNDLLIPQRMTHEHKMEDYSIDACREDQKEVLSYILQFFKTWYELEKN